VRKSHSAKRAIKGDAKAEEHRLYGSDFCPLLPRDLYFHGALGHFARNPETGRKLQSNQSSNPNSQSESLLAVMGHILPSKRARAERNKMLRQALQDMRAVVEEALGGYAVAWQPPQGNGKGQWLSLQDAAELPENELLQKISWFLFIAPDFHKRLATDLEKYHAERYAHGKTPYAIRVTQNPEEARKGHLQVAGEHFDGEDDSQPIRARLKLQRAEQGLSQAKVGEIFGVSQKTIDYWEKGPLADASGRVRGKPIPREMLPFILRWLETGQTPTPDELAARTTRRAGVRRKKDPDFKKSP
jgi:DNA-binding XRE family transcriptional regulator